MKKTSLFTTLMRGARRILFAHWRNEAKMKRQTHLRQKTREFPKAPNRQAHRMAIWRGYRGI
jgi:hypothetical protein